ncbi:non-ribosomal peptide synthetase [Desulfosediminicola flagellatus]|uniref:non-ribosomal peptide synthetase n=1 Tax=Desulfosediminicola flagellatus TaxID=2569541 RepID=UPI0010AC9793|nr:non-ribosomal peptide synthetase [Desulfosediminicola flagellatus]
MIRIEKVLSQLGTQGVKFWLEGETLHYRAPRGTLNAETIQTLRSRKPEILAFLRSNRAEDSAAAMLPSLATGARNSGLLSFGQQGLWVLHQMNGGHAAYNIPEAVVLNGPLDRNVLRQSLQKIVERHAMLRASIREDKGDACLYVAESVNVDIPVVDIRWVEPHERKAKALHRITTEADSIFDLQAGPLFRTCLVQLGEHEHIFCLTMHHMIADGWSKGILSKELAAYYNSYLKGVEPELKQLNVDYRDFVYWQRKQLTNKFLEPHIQYWQETLKNLPSPASLLPDRFRPARPRGRGRVIVREFGHELTRAIKEIARETGCTLYMALATVFVELLRRYKNDNDCIFGTPTANRPFKELYDLLGFFVNSLVIRVAADGRLSYEDLVAQVRQTTLDAFAHQIVPFEKVVEVLGQRQQSFSPIFQIGFVLQDGTIEPPKLDGLHVEQIQVERTTAKYDLSLIAVETRDKIVLEWEYATDLFEDDTIVHLASSFQHLAEEAMKSPSKPLQLLDCCNSVQRALVIDTWSRSSTIPVPELCLHELFSASATQNPDRLAVVCGGQRLTYRQLDERSDAIALHLERVGADTETVIGVCLDRSVDLIASILAILKTGAAYLPLEPDHPKSRLHNMLSDSEAQIIIAADNHSIPDISGVTVVDPLQISQTSLNRGATFQTKRTVRPDNLAYLIYTSGSTGTPKGVMIEHRSVVNLIGGLEEIVYSHYQGPQQVSLFASTVFDASVQQIFAALCGGHTLHVLDTASRENHSLLLDYWREEGVTIADGTPTLLRLLLESGLAEMEGLALKHLIIGGEPLPYETVNRLQSGSFGRRLTVTNIYGPTECCVDATAFTCPSDVLPELAIIPIGRPMANTETYILDEQRQPVAPGMPGELYIGGPGVGRGYLGLDALTADRFVDNPFFQGKRLYRTGDRVRFLADGTIAFLGRTDNQVKVNGYRIETGEIEQCLRQYSMVRDAVVCTRETENSHYELVAYLAVGDERVTLEHLYGGISEKLPHYMIPARFFTLSSFPRSTSGKVDRSALLSLDLVQLQKESQKHCPPRTEKEKILSGVWQDVLNVEAPDIHDKYFMLGGDSIKALQIVSRLRKHHYQIALKDIFQFPTIAQLAPLMKEGIAARPHSHAIGRVPLTSIQSWFFEHFTSTKHHFHQAVLLRPAKRMDESALRGSLQILQAHHDMLRSRFFEDDTGVWRQEVMEHTSPVRFEYVDLRQNALGLDAMREHSCGVMSRTDLAAGSPFAAVLYRMHDDDRLLLTAHHLVVDGVSWRILLQDLHSAYTQILSGNEPGLGVKTTSFKEWSDRLAVHAQSLQPKRRIWSENTSNIQSKPVSSPYVSEPFTYKERQRHSKHLSRDLSKRLQTHVHQAYQTGITDMLVCAFGRAVHNEAGTDCFAITLEGYGRESIFEDVELDRTVGWFTSMYPVVLDFSSSVEVAENIQAVQRAIHKAGSVGIEFGMRRWGSGSKSSDRREALPPILFNYLGDFDGELRSDLFELATEEVGAVIHPDAIVPFALEVTGMCTDGRIQLSIEYGTTIDTSRVKALMASWVEELHVVVNHALAVVTKDPGPSTIDYTGVGSDEVNSFLNTFTES